MAKKKEEKEVTVEKTVDRKDEVKVEPTIKLFDWTIPFKALECSNMFKQGLKEYILSNGLEIKSDKEFEKIVKDYTNLKIGG